MVPLLFSLVAVVLLSHLSVTNAWVESVMPSSSTLSSPADSSPKRSSRDDNDVDATRLSIHTEESATTATGTASSSISLAFLGNSIFYYNDCPRLLQRMMQESGLYQTVYQDSCLRGGASLISLFKNGNGMETKFGTTSVKHKEDNESKNVDDIGAPTVQALIDGQVELMQKDDAAIRKIVVIANDQTQSPARESTRQATVDMLRDIYRPLLVELQQKLVAVQSQQNNGNQQPTTTLQLVLVQTPAYQFPNIRGTEDLGDFDQFTERLTAGYEAYRDVFGTDDVIECRIAPVGQAYQWLHNMASTNSSLFERLYYDHDRFHPSPHGTWLQAAVLYCCLTRQAPPQYHSNWWNEARYMQPPEFEPMPLPTPQEAATLADVACRVCGIMPSSQDDDDDDAPNKDHEKTAEDASRL